MNFKRYSLRHNIYDQNNKFCMVSIIDSTTEQVVQSILVPIIGTSLDHTHKGLINLKDILLILNKVHEDDLLYLKEVKNFTNNGERKKG